MTFFANFPVIQYKFGDEILSSSVQNLSVYIDLIDQIADDASFYETYTIIDGERPDSLSYKLYDTIDFYWTFYLLNEKIRRQGWPLTFQELYKQRNLYYPHKVIKTNDTFFDRMYVGDTVIQGALQNPTSIGTVVKRDFDTGQIFINPDQEVRNITITNPGSGYTTSPTITIFDEHGEKHDEAIINATASATLTNGSISSINVLFGGKGYSHAPTVKISPPNIIDWDKVAETIELVVNGQPTTYKRILKTIIRQSDGELIDTYRRRIRFWIFDFWVKVYEYLIDETVIEYVTNDYTNLITDTFNGFQRGDITRKGEITQEDANLLRSFASNPSNVKPDYRARIIDGLQRAIVNNYQDYPDWVPNGPTSEQATAVATLSNNFFSTTQLISVPGVANWRDFTGVDQKSVSVNSVTDQYNAIHHYENSDGEWVDIDPTDDLSAALYTPVTYFERLERQNEDLKTIRILKPDVVNQVYAEFQRLLQVE